MKQRYLSLLSAGHLFTDLNQGALPAILPFLIIEHNLSYAAAAGLVFAANFASSIVQPLFGHLADKISKPWLMPTGILLAGFGLAFTGFIANYWLLFIAVTISGIGIAAFHPEAARLANKVSGEKKGTGISIFAVGGNAGFALGPLVTTGALLFLGLKGTLVLIVPVLIMAAVMASQLSGLAQYQSITTKSQSGSPALTQKDEWGPFSRLTVVVFCRSTIFYGLNTFIPLYWLSVLQQSTAVSGTALTIMFTVGAIGTLIGGRLADNYGYNRVVKIGFTVLLPILLAFITTKNVTVATLLLIPIGFALFAPFSPMIVLGQKYLPNRMGLASGVTLGLAVSVGGVTTPALGWVADHYGIHTALTIIAYIPIIAALTAFTLPVPNSGLKPEAPVNQKASPTPR